MASSDEKIRELFHIEQLTLANNNFRQVYYTTAKKDFQMVFMSLNPGEDIGMETHPNITQFIRVENDSDGIAILDGKECHLYNGVAVIINPGVKHNIINKGKTPMKLYTIYVPANHPPDRIDKTKPKED